MRLYSGVDRSAVDRRRWPPQLSCNMLLLDAAQNPASTLFQFQTAPDKTQIVYRLGYTDGAQRRPGSGPGAANRLAAGAGLARSRAAIRLAVGTACAKKRLRPGQR